MSSSRCCFSLLFHCTLLPPYATYSLHLNVFCGMIFSEHEDPPSFEALLAYQVECLLFSTYHACLLPDENSTSTLFYLPLSACACLCVIQNTWQPSSAHLVRLVINCSGTTANSLNNNYCKYIQLSCIPTTGNTRNTISNNVKEKQTIYIYIYINL